MLGDDLTFDAAVKLAREIRQRDYWHVFSIEPVSGSMLTDDAWGIEARCALDWTSPHYIRTQQQAAQWIQYAETFERAMSNRKNS